MLNTVVFYINLFILFPVVSSMQLNGIVLSNNSTRYNHTKNTLINSGFIVNQKVFLDPQSDIIKQELGLLGLSYSDIKLPKEKLKMYLSNKLSFLEAIESFVNEPNSISNSTDWKFFFEDDISLHPSLIYSNNTATLIKQALHIDSIRREGLVYLGLCIPHCEPTLGNIDNINISKCYGFCAHAFGIAKWKSRHFLRTISSHHHHRFVKLRHVYNILFACLYIYNARTIYMILYA